MRRASGTSGRLTGVALSVLSLLAATLIGLGPRPTDAATITQVVTASADTYVDSSAPSTALGTRTNLNVDASPSRSVYLRFNLTSVTGTITAATLRLHAQDSTDAPSPVGGTVRKISTNSWSEAVTTYNNRPSTSGTTVGSFGAVARNTWYQMNALSVVAAGAVVNLAIVSSNTNGATYDARETGANAPQLVLTIETPPSGTTQPSSTTQPSATTAPQSTVTLAPTADTYVENGTAAGTNFGTAATFVADNSPIRQSFLRFDLGAVPAVTSAKLRLHVANNSNGPSPSGGTVTRVTGTWVETTTTWNDRPTVGATVIAFGAVTQNTWVEVDVTGAVAAGTTVELGLTSTNTDGAYYDSRESGATAPQLVLVTAALPTTPPATPPPATTPPTTPPTAPPTVPPTAPPTGIVVAAAGDIACAPTSAVTSTTCRQLSVSNLIYNDPSVEQFLALGDLQYPNGELANFQAQGGYGGSFGRFIGITRPAPGNHEYNLGNANGYFSYFGAQAGDPTKGYFSFDVGTTWHIVSLNSNCTYVSCAAGAAQEQWLRADLLASTRPCTIAYFHHPRWTSAARGDNTNVDPLWRAIADDGGEIVLAGHEHVYERFAPMSATGAADANAVRAIVVGTGGNSLGSFGATHANSLVRLQAFGVLKLTLSASSYTWQMVNESGTVLDSGTGTCH